MRYGSKEVENMSYEQAARLLRSTVIVAHGRNEALTRAFELSLQALAKCAKLDKDREKRRERDVAKKNKM